jgi:serine/threonine-protein kinase HipA
MTLLGYTDGQDYLDGVSYLELATFIANTSPFVQVDLEQLWRRIVFSICVSNIDDHLRNHGFILTSAGWRLSPAYDINPVETGTGLKLNISESDNALDLSLALEVIPFFRLTTARALLILEEVKKAVGGWRAVATSMGIPNQQIEAKSIAFQKAVAI